MNDQVLIELTKKWEAKALLPEVTNADDELGNAYRSGEEETLKRCAMQLKTLVGLLGDN